jgi:DNA-binding NtrC family response regulator
VRELRNVICRAILVASDVIEPEHLSFLCVDACPVTARWREPEPIGLSLKEIAEAAVTDAEQAIGQALEITRGNKGEAARLLRVDYETLHLKVTHYGIEADDFLAS